MKRQSGMTLAAGAAFIGMAAVCSASVTVTRTDYNGWTGAYRMQNGTVELVFVPQIGRILRFGKIGGTNMLWENSKLFGSVVDVKNPGTEWANFGGDKLWNAPQSVWGWPPDPYIDAGMHTVKITRENHLLVTGQTSKKYGIRFSREIILDESGTGVTLHNTLTNQSGKPVEWSVWEVTQVNDPEEMTLPLWMGGRFKEKGYYTFKDSDPQAGMLRLEGEFLKLKRHPEKASKIGSDSPEGWLVARKGDQDFMVKTKLETGKTYPDDGCALEIYTNGDPLKYVELELLSPIHRIEPHKSVLFTTYWHLDAAKP